MRCGRVVGVERVFEVPFAGKGSHFRERQQHMKVLGYARRSTDKQAMSVEVQAQQLRDAAGLIVDWELELRVEDAASGGSMTGRPVLAQALDDLKAGKADALAVTKLDRLSRSVADFAGLLKTAEREGWHVICMDIGVDTRASTGRLLAHVTAAVAEWERERIRQRTREGMAYIKATTGKHMGRPSHIPVETVERIAALHDQGLSASAIARLLNDEGVSKGPTAKSQLWHHSHVVAAVRREEARSHGVQR